MQTNILKACLGAVLSVSSVTVLAQSYDSAKPVHGEYQNWRLVSISYREDNKTLRAILGNHKAITAARKGKTLPWTDGAILAKIIWKESKHKNWPQAFVPGEFAKAEAMIKDSKKYASTGGWGFAHWQDGKLEMHDKATSETCFACHTIMKDNDYVFTSSALQ